MTHFPGQPEAIFGGPLLGDQALRFIFMDEAGTSAAEPVTVVVGLIANADEHVLSAEAAVLEAIGAVPPALREGFVFHATDIFGNKKYQDGSWSMTDRLDLLHTMMSIPKRLGMGICVGATWRGAVDFSTSWGIRGLTPAQSDHMQAFCLCIGVADRMIRKHAGLREVATIVAEDIEEMRKHLRVLPRAMRTSGLHIPAMGLRQTTRDKDAGYSMQRGDLRITRIRDTVHFVNKQDDRLVWLADACAYGLRRYFAREKFGDEFAESVVNNKQEFLAHFESPGGAECQWPHRPSALSYVL